MTCKRSTTIKWKTVYISLQLYVLNKMKRTDHDTLDHFVIRLLETQRASTSTTLQRCTMMGSREFFIRDKKI